jgi:hypothetical protein
VRGGIHHHVRADGTHGLRDAFQIRQITAQLFIKVVHRDHVAEVDSERCSSQPWPFLPISKIFILCILSLTKKALTLVQQALQISTVLGFLQAFGLSRHPFRRQPLIAVSNLFQAGYFHRRFSMV